MPPFLHALCVCVCCGLALPGLMISTPDTPHLWLPLPPPLPPAPPPLLAASSSGPAGLPAGPPPRLPIRTLRTCRSPDADLCLTSATLVRRAVTLACWWPREHHWTDKPPWGRRPLGPALDSGGQAHSILSIVHSTSSPLSWSSPFGNSRCSPYINGRTLCLLTLNA